MATTTATQIQQLYVGLLGRAADKSGLDWWVDQVTTGGRTLEDIRASFVTSTEYTTTYGAAATRAELVTSIYQNLFERTPSADEVKYWAETDTRPADQLVAAFIEFGSANDQKVIANKVFVAQTYTDTVGTTNFDKGAAKSVIDSVNGTPASVTTAINTITSGSLPGLTPGVNLISALNTANAAKDAYAKQVATANPAFDKKLADGTTDGKDGAVSFAEAQAALKVSTDARTAAVKAADGSLAGTESVALLNAQKSDAATVAGTAKTAALAVTAGTLTGAAAAKAIADYDAAVAAQTAAVKTPAQVQADTAAQAAALAGVKSSITATSAVTYDTLAAKVTNTPFTTVPNIVNEATLYAALASDKLNAVEHANLVAEVSKVPTFGTALVASAEKELAVTKLANAVTTTENEVKKIDSDDTGVLQQGQDYIDKAIILASKTAAVNAANSSETAIATAKAVVDQYTTLNKASDDASTAINNFNNAAANVGKVAITGLTGGTAEGTAAKDVFFFPSKIAGTSDVTIGTTTAFGAGDSIVLGSSYTFNSGALSTGNNTALEVFFVKGATGTQVVVESNAVGSATAVTGTDGTVTTHNDVAVINLVGVTADQLSFNNGVVSYV